MKKCIYLCFSHTLQLTYISTGTTNKFKLVCLMVNWLKISKLWWGLDDKYIFILRLCNNVFIFRNTLTAYKSKGKVIRKVILNYKERKNRLISIKSNSFIWIFNWFNAKISLKWHEKLSYKYWTKDELQIYRREPL